MSATRFWRCTGAVATTELLQLLRDRFSLALLVSIPAVQIILFGFTVNLDPKDVPIAIAGPGAALARSVVDQTEYFAVVGGDLAAGEALTKVRLRQALIAVETGLDQNSRPAVSFAADASDPAAIRPALLALQLAFWRNQVKVWPATLSVQWLYNEDGKGSWAIAPGLIGVVVMITTLLLGALSLVRERERGTWESLLTTPATSLELMIGKLLPLLLFALLQSLVILSLAQVLFAVPLRGSLVALALAVALFALTHLLVGFAISALASNELQAIQFAVFFYLPCMLLSGFMFPFQGMPHWAQLIAEGLPLTHFIRVARGIMLRADGALFIVNEMLPVAIMALVLSEWVRRKCRSRLS